MIWGYPYFRKHPYIYIYNSHIVFQHICPNLLYKGSKCKQIFGHMKHSIPTSGHHSKIHIQVTIPLKPSSLLLLIIFFPFLRKKNHHPTINCPRFGANQSRTSGTGSHQEVLPLAVGIDRFLDEVEHLCFGLWQDGTGAE